MGTELNGKELQTLLVEATWLEDAEQGGEEDYVFASLYKSQDGRFFRLITSSGMNSKYMGAGDVGEWLEGDDLENWDELD